MSRNESELSELEIPGSCRVVLMVYRKAGRRYAQPFSEPHIKVHSRNELKRLWRAIVQVIERREWTDDYVARTRESGTLTTVAGPAELTS